MSSASEEFYDVEKILDHRIHKGTKQYLIKWLGYPESECTWEDETNIFCDELKEEYEASRKKKKMEDKKYSGVVTKKKNRIQITNEWDEYITKIVGVSKAFNGQLEVEYLTINGEEGTCSIDEIHIKAPIHLIEFYESNLIFQNE